MIGDLLSFLFGVSPPRATARPRPQAAPGMGKSPGSRPGKGRFPGKTPQTAAKVGTKHGQVKGAGIGVWQTAKGRLAHAQSRPASVAVYHGTQTLESARSIVRHGWIVGTGNALGDGVYTTTSVDVAKSYATASGYVLQAQLDPGKSTAWTPTLAQAFQAWCKSRGCVADMAARTAFLKYRGFHTLQEGNVYVVLYLGLRNPAATKVKVKRLRVVRVFDAATGRTVWV